MKKLIIILSILLITNCGQRDNEIELIRPTDEIYVFIPKVVSPDGRIVTKVYDISNTQVEKISQAIDEIKVILQKSGKNFEINELTSGIPFSPNQFLYTLYINELGKIDKVVVITSQSQDVDKYLINQMKDWEMEIFTSNNTPQKYSINWEFSLFLPKGSERLSLHNSSLKVFEKINLSKKEDFHLKVEQMPMPIGGMREIAKNVHYPEIAKRAGIEGRVFVKAFIDESGNVVETEIIKGIGGGCDQAALDAIEATKFKPGRKNGKPVKVQVSIPIMFKLD